MARYECDTAVKSWVSSGWRRDNRVKHFELGRHREIQLVGAYPCKDFCQSLDFCADGRFFNVGVGLDDNPKAWHAGQQANILIAMPYLGETSQGPRTHLTIQMAKLTCIVNAL